ncbi:MAG: ribonuclease P protein component [Nitrospinaceae bacterium]
MRSYTFGKRERLAKRTEFETVMARGRKKKIDSTCTLFFLANGLDRKRLGIIASKRIGNAVVRNRAKRKIREVFRHIKNRIHPPMDIVVISGRDLVRQSFSSLEEKISKTLLSNR